MQHVCSLDQTVMQEPDICQVVLSASVLAAPEPSRQGAQVTPQRTETRLLLHIWHSIYLGNNQPMEKTSTGH